MFTSSSKGNAPNGAACRGAGPVRCDHDDVGCGATAAADDMLMVVIVVLRVNHRSISPSAPSVVLSDVLYPMARVQAPQCSPNVNIATIKSRLLDERDAPRLFPRG